MSKYSEAVRQRDEAREECDLLCQTIEALRARMAEQTMELYRLRQIVAEDTQAQAGDT